MSGDQYDPQTFPYHSGDILLLYTDGVTEARDAQGTFYPLTQRAAAWASLGPVSWMTRLTRTKSVRICSVACRRCSRHMESSST